MSACLGYWQPSPALSGLLEKQLLTPFIYSLFLNHLSSPQPRTKVLPPPQGMLGGHHHNCNYLDHSALKRFSTCQHQLCSEIIHIPQQFRCRVYIVGVNPRPLGSSGCEGQLWMAILVIPLWRATWNPRIGSATNN